MNLVVDDAVEVTQAKGDQPERRRELGMSIRFVGVVRLLTKM
jgi:hypothetical protein